MRRLAIIGTLLVGLIAGLGVTGTPAQAAARQRVKVMVTSLSGERIMIIEGFVRCRTSRADQDCERDDMTWEEVTRKHYKRTVRVARTKTVSFVFLSDRGFRMQVFVNGVRRAREKADNWNGLWAAGFAFYSPGALTTF